MLADILPCISGLQVWVAMLLLVVVLVGLGVLPAALGSPGKMLLELLL